MKIFTNKQWEFEKEKIESYALYTKTHLELRNAILKLIESSLNISFDGMSGEEVLKWLEDYKEKLYMSRFEERWNMGAKAGINSICNALEKCGALKKTTCEKIRYRAIKNLEESAIK